MAGRPRTLTHEIRKEILKIREKENLSYAKISQRLGVPVGTVKAVFHDQRRIEGTHIITLEVPLSITKKEALRRLSVKQVPSEA